MIVHLLPQPQVGANPSPLSRYAERDTTRREHLAELQEFHFRPRRK